MNEDKKYELIGVFAVILLLIIAVSAAAERDNLKQQAVDRGFAEWKVIGENETEFVWKENTNTKTPTPKTP